MTILDKIIDRIKADMAQDMNEYPLSEAILAAESAGPCRDFFGAFAEPRKVRVIAELKKASPSKGLIRDNFDPAQLCIDLQGHGAAALSVLTEKNFFLGSMKYLEEVTKLVRIPVLRKDFIFDPYQIYRARAAGADAVLLIAAALDPVLFAELHALATSLGLHVLCEVHNHEELEMVLNTEAKIIGINSRNLKTFKTDLKIAVEMLRDIPDDKVKIAESGINNTDDIKRMINAGTSGFLIGESLMREKEPGRKLAELIAGGVG